MSKEKIPQYALLFGLPVKLEYGLGMIEQPKLKDFNDFDIGIFERSFNMRKEKIFEEVPDGVKNFDCFFLLMLSDEDTQIANILFYQLIQSLCVLYKCTPKDILLKKTQNKADIGMYYLQIQDKYILNRDNYDYLCKVISTIMAGEYIETDEKGEMSEIEKKIAKARAKWEREHPKKQEDGYTIYDLINYILHTDGTTYTYDNIQELTIYQIKNTSKLYSEKEGYRNFMDYKTSGQYEINEERPHWFFSKK